MGKRGPKPTPTAALRLAASTLVDGRAGEYEPDSKLPTPPDGLSQSAVDEWNRLGPILVAAGLLSLNDRAQFAAYCQAWADWHKANTELQALGSSWYDTDSGLKRVHPLISVRQDAWNAMKNAARAFGLSPADRVGLTVDDSGSRGNSEDDSWKSGRRSVG